eukprot:COSAG01_NODE_10446_length_2164_cov_1.476513_1_plen_106_part_00
MLAWLQLVASIASLVCCSALFHWLISDMNIFVHGSAQGQSHAAICVKLWPHNATQSHACCQHDWQLHRDADHSQPNVRISAMEAGHPSEGSVRGLESKPVLSVGT